jgi:ABC-type transporter Mla maintaining outer membrane lipid asymmetry ATPase subunit MlaF
MLQSDLPMAMQKPILQVTKLDLVTGQRHPTVGVSLTVNCENIWMIMGENGVGKSLLVTYLAGQRPVEPGLVSWWGVDIRDTRAANIVESKLGFVFQNLGLLKTRSVFENVALRFLRHGIIIGEHLEEHVLNRLKLVGCEHLARRLPSDLSESDCRLVAIARALAGNTRVLVADEPFLGLSSSRQGLLLELIDALVRSRALDAVIICTHQLSLAETLKPNILTLKKA